VYWPGFQYEYEQRKFGSVTGVESIALPFHWAVMPGKIGSICARNCFANLVTAAFVAVVVYGLDWPMAPAVFAPGYSTRMPVDPLCARVTSQPLWND